MAEKLSDLDFVERLYTAWEEFGRLMEQAAKEYDHLEIEFSKRGSNWEGTTIEPARNFRNNWHFSAKETRILKRSV